MKVNIQVKLTSVIALLIFGLMLFSTYFISRAVEWRLTSMFRTHLDSTLSSVGKEYTRIKDETLASAKSFAQMMSIVRNVLLKERLEVQKEVTRLKAGVELDILEVGDEQGLVMVGGRNLEQYGEDKSHDPLIQAALAGEATVSMEPMPTGFFIRAVSPIKLEERVLGTFTTGYFLDESFLNKIKKMTGVELFLFQKEEEGKEKIIASTLPVEKFLLQTIFNRILQQEYAYVNIGNKPYAVGIIAIPHRKEELIGAVRGALPSEQLMATVAEMKRFLILIGLIGVILASGIGYMFARRITVPIRLLVQGTEKLAKGDLTYRVKVKAEDEIGDLADSFNKMAGNLSRSIQKEKELAVAAAAAVVDRKRAAELERAYKELQEAQHMLVQAEKLSAVGQLASGVAHEVRNPLGIILQGINYLETKISPKQDTSEILTIIKNSVKRADRIIISLVDFSRASELDLQPQDINSVLEDCLALVKTKYKFKNIDAIRETKKDIPKVLIDRNRIEQVFINAFLNAIQAMSEGGKITVRSFAKQLEEVRDGVGARKEDHFRLGERAVIVEIEDTGSGISEENLRKVFDPFFTTKGPRGGSGLGLSVSRNIITMHKGLMDVESQINKGTKVTITLRIAGA